jgi:hypothetical protein
MGERKGKIVEKTTNSKGHAESSFETNILLNLNQFPAVTAAQSTDSFLLLSLQFSINTSRQISTLPRSRAGNASVPKKNK